jgi:hypothetical protein
MLRTKKKQIYPIIPYLMQHHALTAHHDDNAHSQNPTEDKKAGNTLPNGMKSDALDRKQD